jgi:excisionase family DNA binding protein
MFSALTFILWQMKEQIQTTAGRILIAREQATQELGISLRMLDHLIARRRINFVRIGRRVMFRLSDLETFVARNLVPACDMSGAIR